MQVTETKAEGLKREYKLVVTAETLDAKTTEKLEVLRKDIHLKGFRKGKAPLKLMKQRFGKSVLGEVVQETVENTVADHLKEQGHRPARQPDIKIENEKFEEGDDLKVEIAYECLPEVPEIDFSAIKLERRVVTVDDASIDEALDRLAKGSVSFEAARGRGAAAEDGDQVVIDFVGRIDGEVFDGGEAEDYPLVLGSESFIPGFEGAADRRKGGRREGGVRLVPRAVRRTEPGRQGRGLHRDGEGGAQAQARRDQRRAGAALWRREPRPAERAAARADRQRVCRRRAHAAEASAARPAGRAGRPSSCRNRWSRSRRSRSPTSSGTRRTRTITATITPRSSRRDEHLRLAERRVRLGLLLADIGSREKVEIGEAELGQAIMAQARRYPGQEREFFEFVRQNREALEQIRAPLYEDKVVDLILAKAEVTETPVGKDELQAELDKLDEDAPAATAAAAEPS